ncbi:uncharacterized protein LOC129580592 [Paramacrobiotus metropolitanus]|uniref:uncharacterized protein LOC129580592 n=1 Tax=Paramacrobiotus metropolitanus TaxID=2943436 RepID=UPI002445E2DD|nr:uncharacterized protein LOC129580592 [Paramacrobiotus metropolitanus]
MATEKLGNGTDFPHPPPRFPSKPRLPNNHMDNGNRASSVATLSSVTSKKFDALSTTTGHSSISRLKLALGRCSDDPRTVKGRRSQLAKILLLAGIPIVILLIQTGFAVKSALTEQQAASAFRKEVEFAIQAGAVVHALGLERGTTTFYCGMMIDRLLAPVLVRRKMVDDALNKMTLWPTTGRPDDFYATKQDMILQIVLNRIFVNSSTPDAQLTFFTDMVAGLLNWIGSAVVQSQSQDQPWQELVGYHLFISAKEGFAAERSSGTIYYSKGNMTTDEYIWHLDKRSQGQVLLNKSLQYDAYISKMLEQRWYSSGLRRNITAQRQLINENNGYVDIDLGLFYYAQMTNFQNILYDIETNLTASITNNLSTAVNDSNISLWIQIFVVIVAAILFPSVIILLNHITSQIHGFAQILQTKNEEVMREKKRTETVLNQLMPRQIAEKIKMGQPIYPESFDQVTIFFSDIVSFTDLSAASTPLQVVDTLNKLYTIMDNRIEAYDVYKVETIGDAYLCVSGLPERNGNKHSFEIASMALELIPDVSGIVLPHKPEYRLRIRIGIHTGPCVAGVIGNKMPRYCVFGDTVNTASRMESNGEGLRIHCSQSSYDAITFFGVFELEKRGEIPIKGKGLMTTYWLVGRKETKRKLFGPEVQDKPSNV